MVTLLTKAQVAKIVGWHPEHCMAMARRGKFPQPVKLGVGRTSAVRFVASEIDEWVAERMAERDLPVIAST